MNLDVTGWVGKFHYLSRFLKNIQSIVQALKFIHIKELETIKIDKTFDIISEQDQNICTSIGIFITMNRNIEDRDKKKYYKQTYFIPDIDRIIMDLTTRISENDEKVSMISNLLT